MPRFLILYVFFLFLSLSLSVSAFDWSFCVYFCMFPVCPLCCFIVIPMDPVSEINDDDDDDVKDQRARNKVKNRNVRMASGPFQHRGDQMNPTRGRS